MTTSVRGAARGATLRLAGCLVAGLAACAIPFPATTRPAAVVGVWIDTAHSSASDTVAWVLAGSGRDGAMHVRVDARRTPPRVSRSEDFYARWYVTGDVADTARRRLCFAARRAAACYRFALDTVPAPSAAVAPVAAVAAVPEDNSSSAAPARAAVVRRLTLLEYRGRHHTRDIVLLERPAPAAVPTPVAAPTRGAAPGR